MSSPRNAENPKVRISAFFAKSLIQVAHSSHSFGPILRRAGCRYAQDKARNWARVPAPSGTSACNPVRLRRYRGPGGWRWTGHSPTGSGPEGSSPNELRFGSLVNLLPPRRLVHAWERGRPARGPARGMMSEADAAGRLAEPGLDLGATTAPHGEIGR